MPSGWCKTGTRHSSTATSCRPLRVSTRQKLDRNFVRDVAFDLAEASQGDPRNLDVLHNLDVLFTYAGDPQRAEAARAIATGIAAR